MIIAPSLGIIFIHIHKTGGTSIEALLEPFLSWNDLQLGSSILGTAMNRPYKARFGLTKHSSLKEIALVCGDENVKRFYCFAVVREPVARIFSLYNFTARTVQILADSNQLSIKDMKSPTAEITLKYPQLLWKPIRAFFDTDGFSGFLRHQALWEARAMNSQVASLRTEGVSADVRLTHCDG